MKRQIICFLFVLLPVICGCAAKQRPATNWRLARGLILVPPQPPQGQSVLLRNARSVKKNDPKCDLAYPEIQLAWRGRTARVTIRPDITGAAAGAVTVKGGPVAVSGTPVVDLSWWVRFNAELAERETNGCLAAGDAARLTARIVENVPMPSSLAYQLRYGNFIRTGYIDLEPEFILRSVAPLLKPGVDKYRSPEDIAGYETVLYDVKRRGGGAKITTRSVEHNMLGRIVNARRPLTEVIALPESVRYARYYFRMWSVAGDRKLALLAARSPALLAKASSRFEADPEGFCKMARSAEAACLTVPAQMMIAPELKVLVNGKPAFVLVGGSIGQVLRGEGVKDAAPLLPRLQVSRPYAGTPLPVEFDRTRPDIFGLIPIGGEDIRW